MFQTLSAARAPTQNAGPAPGQMGETELKDALSGLDEDPLTIASMMMAQAGPAASPMGGEPPPAGGDAPTAEEATTAVAVDGGRSDLSFSGAKGALGAAKSSVGTLAKAAAGGVKSAAGVTARGVGAVAGSSVKNGAVSAVDGTNPTPDRSGGTLGRVYDAWQGKKDSAGFSGNATVLGDQSQVFAGAKDGDGFFGELDDPNLQGSGSYTGATGDGAAGAGARGGAYHTGFGPENIWGRGGEAGAGAAIEGKAGVGGSAAARAKIDSTYGGASADAKVGSFLGASGDAGAEGWVKGTQVGVNAHGTGSLGVDASGAASASASGGPRIGSVDPETGLRRHMFQAGGSVSGESFVGATGSATGEAWAGLGGAGAAADVSASLGGRVSGSAAGGAKIDIGGFTPAGIDASVEGEGFLGVKGAASGRVTAGLEGVHAQGAANASAVLSGQVGGSVTGSFLGGHGGINGGVTGAVAATAGADGQIGAGLGRLGAAGSVEAFAGARAKGNVGAAAGFLGVDVVSGNIEGAVQAGAGGSIGAGIFMKDGVLTISGGAGASVGVGASVSGSISVDFFSPFKMFLKMLAANGVVSADPNQWIPDIVGWSTGALKFEERAGSGMVEEKDPRVVPLPGAPAGTASKLAVASTQDARSALAVETATPMPDDNVAVEAAPTSSGPDTLLELPGVSPADATTLGDLQQIVQAAGGKMDMRSGSIDMSATRANPADLVGELPGVMGAKHDKAVAEAMNTLGAATDLAQEAASDAQGGIQGLISQLAVEFSNPVDLFKNVLQGALAAVQTMVANGVASAGQLVSSLVEAAGQTIATVGKLLAALVKALFGQLTDLFSGYNGHSNDMANAFMTASDEMKSNIEGIKVGQIFNAKSALMEGLMGVAASFSNRADGLFQAAQDKSRKAEDMVRGVQNKPIDLGVGTGKFVVDPKASSQFKDVTNVLGNMTGAASETADEVGAAGPDMGGEADDVAASADQAASQGGSEMRGTFDGPKSKNDRDVATKKAESDKRMAEFKADPVGTTIKEVGKAIWSFVTGIFKPKK